MNKDFFKGKTVLILGLGKFGGGVDSAKFAAKCAEKVIITDTAKEDKLADALSSLKECPNIDYCLGQHRKSDIDRSDIIIVNPAISYANAFVQYAIQSNKIITSQIEIFFRLFTGTTVGITGSNGKSTTTALTAHLLSSNPPKMRTYDKVWLAGNIGNQPLLDKIDKMTQDDIVVLELSSFQLEQLAQIKQSPNVALLTNLTPNHLDRHGTFENYRTAKENIFKFQQQGDFAIFNSSDPQALDMYEYFNANSLADRILYNEDDLSHRLAELFRLPGKANLSNLAGAVAIARHFKVGNKSIKRAVMSFKSLPHRLELISKKGGIRWYNDSISTTPESTIVALEAFGQPKILIAGGYDKGISFDKLGNKIDELADAVKAVILIGQTADKIADAISCDSVEIIREKTLEKAVKTAKLKADKGDVVLLSPACASYDMFTNFQERGELFKKLVKTEPQTQN